MTDKKHQNDKCDEQSHALRIFDDFGVPDSQLRTTADIAASTSNEGSVSTIRINTNTLIQPGQVPGPPNVNCSVANFMDIFGSHTTGSTGKSSFRLTNYLCKDKDILFVEPVFIVATARNGSATFVTATATIIDDGEDVEISLEGLSADGSASKNKNLNWSCRVRTSEPVIS